jgi:manganese-dependent inorganic pyrophosphatase
MNVETAAGLQASQTPVYVIGHRNPDTDSVVSAIGYAWLLRERDKLNAQPARAGMLAPQTTFALSAFNLEPPQLLNDASPRFSHVARPVRALTPDRPLQEAWALIAENGRVAPVVDADGKPAGLLTAASVFHFLTRRLPGKSGRSPDGADCLLFGDVLATPCGEAAVRDIPSFEAGTRIKDIIGRVLRSERDNFLIVDRTNRYVGVCWKSDLYRPPRLKLVLIDHNELSQAVLGVEEAELLEVLDHHRLAIIPTNMPIAFHVDPVGSSSTLVTERIMRSGLSVPRPVAGALLSGLLSDTLLLKSPTTTDRDRVAAVQLAAWSFPGQGDFYKAMTDYGWELLRAGAGLESRTAESIVSGDYKEYESGKVRFGLAQVEVADMREIEPRLEELRSALAAMERERRLDFAALMVTDILETRSRLVTSGATAHLDGLPYSRLDDGTFDLPGVVSRKKQLVPVILNALQV